MRGWLVLAVGLLAATLPWFRSDLSAQTPAGDVARGEAIYQQSCAMCHGADATGMMGMHPALTGVVDRLTVEGVEVAIRQGRDTRPPMPAFGGRLDDGDIAALVAYLDTLPPGPRNFGPEMDRDGMMRDGMMDRMMNRGGAVPLVAVLVVVLLLVLIGLVITLVVNQRGKQTADGIRGETPREILDRRYAAGELSPEEYRQTRDDLEQ